MIKFFSRLAVGLSYLTVWAATGSGQTNSFPAVHDTERSTSKFFSPADAARKFVVPAGFEVTLFAGEPDVRQPIALTTDDRGRLWVAENYTYSDNGRFDDQLRDRIVIFEDADNDGRFDKRTVFGENFKQLTSVAVGFGGVWALCAPDLLFIPDRNGDDVPDGEPQVILNGWALQNVQHNIVNGLMWGPDGWLYGRHGILATSSVGKPSAPEQERTKINCGIWKYHPVRGVFEVVAHGTTNPWGMDFDEFGEGVFINTVIGHLWHLIPGAHYRRMYGQDLNPYAYELIEQHADHYHWDTGKVWHETRTGSDINDMLGGGHAHSGLMIYLGENWPSEYRNTIFTVNLHGYRLNNDRLERKGSGYVGTHGKDFGRTTDPWFRAVDLTYGADGGVYLIDWSDSGECHEADGVHRSSGRIYKITYGRPEKPKVADVSRLSESQLSQLLFHRNEWMSRHARRVLQEKNVAGIDLTKTHKELKSEFTKQKDVPAKLRALWALYVSGGASSAWLIDHLSHPDEQVRVWCVRFLVDAASNESQASHLLKLAQREKSPVVRLAIASALQRLPLVDRGAIATELLSHGQDAKDHNLPLMIWYGIEALAESHASALVGLAESSRIGLVRKLIARRLAQDLGKKAEAVDALVELASSSVSEAFQWEVVEGFSEGMRGWRQAKAPKHWGALRAAVAKGTHQKLKDTVRDLSLVFGDENVIAELRSVALQESAGKTLRREALQKLIENKPANLLPLLQELATDNVLTSVAIKGLSVYEDAKTPALALSYYDQLSPDDRSEVISVLVSRPAYARALLDAVANGRLKRADISAFHARQIASLGNKELNERLTNLWGELRKTQTEKQHAINRYKSILPADRLQKADLSKGRAVYVKTCAPCHKLYGEGASVGPDLTGSGRTHLDYLLENILDPNSIVGADYKMSIVTLKDDTVLNGVVLEKTERTVTLQGVNGPQTVELSQIIEMKQSELSLMPEGLLESLDSIEVANLLAYLMSPSQVPLPK